ncbi:MAG TPA: LptF/LptG family permease, partial [Rhizomicrobium sp.]|nr:LptF/LptG family permease [Rhizomicrobium sp.]
LDAYLGPASMAVQMKERWGLDGQRLDRTRWSVPSWIALPDGLLRAEIEFGPPSVLHNVAYFRRDAHGSLLEAETASVARRRPGTNLWVLQNGHTWNSGQRPSGEQPALAIASSNEQMLPFATRTVRLDIDPLWLTIYGLEAQYISLGTLQALVHSDRDLESVRRYRARLNVLYGETILPGTMGLLAASLSMVFLAYGVTMRSLVGIGFTGYMAHFATKACLLMGQTGYMRPRVAGWSVPIILLVATAAVLAIAQRRRRREKISGA